MPMATSCKLNGKNVSVDKAVDLRDDARRQRASDPDFRCHICKKPVRPHKAGPNNAAHFEHLDRNPKCPLSHRAR
jgi:hypothetical protein